MNRRRFLAASSGAAMLAAAGCELPGNRPPPDLYVLTPKSTFPPSLPTVEWQLLVERPFASAALDVTRIAIATSLTELDYFAGVAWTNRAPDMVQTLMIESFENTGRIVSVGREGVGLRADYVLKCELREFQAILRETGQPPDALVRINAKLVEMPAREIVAFENFEGRSTADANNVGAVVVAFDAALGDVLKDLVAWTLTAVPPVRADDDRLVL